MSQETIAIRLYMDVQIHGSVTEALRQSGHDLITAQADGMRRATDVALLDRATSLGRVLVTHDTDFLAEAAHRQREAIPFAGIVYAHPLNITMAQLIHQLELIMGAADANYMRNRVEWLPM
ncbi:MAG: DUF5615 family PIN-like protein [Tepidisphaeraceae bacterium]